MPSFGHQLVEVDRLVGAVEAADTEVHDADREPRPIVGGHDDARVDLIECPVGDLAQVSGWRWG
jgi:hypothetical protein